MKPGIYLDLPRAEYEAIDAANYSTLKLFEQSPAHARERMLHPTEPTDAMELGTAIHTALLEPEKFATQYIAAPTFDRRTAAGKAAWVEFESKHPGRNYLAPDEMEICVGIIKTIDENETARLLLRGEGRNEVSVVWKDEESGLLCKGRIDRFTVLYSWSVVVDVKSTASAYPIEFTKQSARMGYHVQAAFYMDGLRSLAPAERRYIILAIEKDRPYGISAMELDEQAVADGRARYRTYLKQYADAKRTGIWPGYPSGITPLSLPKWAQKDASYI